MDLFGMLYIPNSLLIAVAIIISLYFYGRRNFAHFTEIGINGPKPIAYLGNLKEMGIGFHQILSDWKKEFGDHYGIFFGAAPILMVSDPEIIGEIMIKNFSNFTNRPIGKLNSGISLKENQKFVDKLYGMALKYLADTSEQYTQSMVTVAKDDHWKYLRTVLAPSYSSKRMREMVPLIEDVLKTFEKNLNKIADSEEAVDVNPLFSGFTMDVIASTGFGFKIDSQENPDSPLVKNARKVFDVDFFRSLQAVAIIFPFIGTIINKIKPSLLLGGMTYFISFCKELVEERKKEKNTSARKDLLQLMLDAQLEGNEKLDKKTEQTLKLESVTDWRTKRGLKDVEIIAQCMIFFLAGYETTANTLSFFAHCIAMNPDVQEKLCQEIDEQLGEESPNYDNVQKLTYLDMCMDETMRMYPVAIVLSRECKEDCTIKGIKICKKTGVMIPVMCLHYDPRYWTEPEKFDPEHFNEENKAKQIPFSYLPFGGGPRMCAGMRLAELEFKMAVVLLLRKFRLVTCDKTKEKIEFSKGGLLKAKDGIWLKIEHRVKS